MTPLDDFLLAHFRYAVSQRLFEDRCRQLTDGKGTPDQRAALVDETLRLALVVGDTAADVEALIADTIEYVQSEGGDPAFLEEISLASNNIAEDTDRANDYHVQVTARRLGMPVRRPRRPRVANPFEFAETEPEAEEPSEGGEPAQEDGTGPSQEEQNTEEPASEESGDPGEAPEGAEGTEGTDPGETPENG